MSELVSMTHPVTGATKTDVLLAQVPALARSGWIVGDQAGDARRARIGELKAELAALEAAEKDAAERDKPPAAKPSGDSPAGGGSEMAGRAGSTDTSGKKPATRGEKKEL